MPRAGLPGKQAKHMPRDLMQPSTLLQMGFHIGDHLLCNALCFWRRPLAAAKYVTIGP